MGTASVYVYITRTLGSSGDPSLWILSIHSLSLAKVRGR